VGAVAPRAANVAGVTGLVANGERLSDPIGLIEHFGRRT
jgi:hypothetical protein